MSEILDAIDQAIDEVERLQKEVEQMERVKIVLASLARCAASLAQSCVDATNQLHGIEDTTRAKRTIKGIELTLHTMTAELDRWSK